MGSSALQNTLPQSTESLSGMRNLVTSVLVAQLFAVMMTLAQINSLAELWQELFVSTVVIQTITMGTYLSWQLIQWLRPQSSLNFYLLCGYVTALVATAAVTKVTFDYATANAMPMSFSTDKVGVHIIRNVAMCAIAGALAVHYLWVQHEWRHNLVREAEARIEALQARIRPHFLFNALNTIAMLTRKNPAAAEESVEDLADLFRASLKKAGNEVRLSEELDICLRYQRMEQFRLGDRLKVHWHIDDLPKNARVPGLCLQPLLENAIYHGVEPAANGGSIEIHGSRDERGFRIEMVNPVPVQRAFSSRNGNQIALDNIRERLELTYGGKSSLELENLGSQYRVTLWFPWREQTTPATQSRTPEVNPNELTHC